MAPNKNWWKASRALRSMSMKMWILLLSSITMFLALAHAHWNSSCASDIAELAQNLCKWARKTFRALFLSASNHSFTHLYIHKSLFDPWKVSLHRERRLTRDRAACLADISVSFDCFDGSDGDTIGDRKVASTALGWMGRKTTAAHSGKIE